MNTLFAGFMYKLLVAFMALCALFAPKTMPSCDDPIKASAPDVKMMAALWGDTHISDCIYKKYRNTKISCLDVANAAEKLDAFVLAGDITEDGRPAEYKAMLDSLLAIDKVDNYIFAVGNHDVRLRNYRQVKKLFTEFYKAVNEHIGDDTVIDELSFVKVIKGYTFIVLGPTRCEFEESYFNNTRLKWFEREMVKASRSGLPIFVICHQPLMLTHNLPFAWGGSRIETKGSVGPQGKDLKRIMNNFDNVFYINGHLHSGFSKYSYEKIDNFHSINLPAIGTKNADGYNEPGLGYIMEVYEDKALFKARSFAEGRYLPEYDIKVDLS